jgi:hypothetical protein
MSANPVFSESSIRKKKKDFYTAMPLIILVPVFLCFLFQAAGYPILWKAFGLGAAGWMAALVLRGPIAAIAMKLPKNIGQNIVVGSSGVLEEGVRFGLLALTGTAMPWALSIGQGWAAIEVLYTIGTGFAMLSLYGRTDDKAIQAKQMLAAQGMADVHPIWGVAERIFASLFHIGATLLIAKEPMMVFVLVPVHSLLNLSVTALLKRSIILVEGAVAVVGVAVMLGGWFW